MYGAADRVRSVICWDDDAEQRATISSTTSMIECGRRLSLPIWFEDTPAVPEQPAARVIEQQCARARHPGATAPATAYAPADTNEPTVFSNLIPSLYGPGSARRCAAMFRQPRRRCRSFSQRMVIRSRGTSSWTTARVDQCIRKPIFARRWKNTKSSPPEKANAGSKGSGINASKQARRTRTFPAP